MAIQVILADDHLIVREGLKSLLEREGFQVVGEASDGHEAVRIAQSLHPDVAVLDFAMPLLNGIDAAREIHKVSPSTKIIVLTMYNENRYVFEALRAGVKGYVLKSQAAEDLARAIQEVSRDSVYLSPGISSSVVEAFLMKHNIPQEPLSARERQVLQLVAEGKSTKEVAAILGVSIKTAESHRFNLMRKLDIHETVSLVRYAIREGLIQI